VPLGERDRHLEAALAIRWRRLDVLLGDRQVRGRLVQAPLDKITFRAYQGQLGVVRAPREGLQQCLDGLRLPVERQAERSDTTNAFASSRLSKIRSEPGRPVSRSASSPLTRCAGRPAPATQSSRYQASPRNVNDANSGLGYARFLFPCPVCRITRNW
jgi:hypothetical protein